MFAVPWTIFHPIDEKSPLFEKSAVDLSREEAEFIVILKGYDETFNQHVHQVNDYKYTEIEFDADFKPMFEPGSVGLTEIFVDKISDYKKVLVMNEPGGNGAVKLRDVGTINASVIQMI